MSDGEETANPFDDIELVEIYAAGSHMGVDRIVMMLQDEGVEALAREITVSEFPSSATERFLVTVPAGDKDKAVELIKQAIADKVLPADAGSFL
jgi:hypothetical protein